MASRTSAPDCASSSTRCSVASPASNAKRSRNPPQTLFTVPMRACPIALASANSPFSRSAVRTRSRSSVAALRVKVVAITPAGLACPELSFSCRICVRR